MIEIIIPSKQIHIVLFISGLTFLVFFIDLRCFKIVQWKHAAYLLNLLKPLICLAIFKSAGITAYIRPTFVCESGSDISGKQIMYIQTTL